MWHVEHAIRFTLAEFFFEESTSLLVSDIGDNNRVEFNSGLQKLLHALECHLQCFGVAFEKNEDGRGVWSRFHKVEEVVGNAGDGEALAMQVGKFFHLKRTFLGNCLCHVLTNE